MVGSSARVRAVTRAMINEATHRLILAPPIRAHYTILGLELLFQVSPINVRIMRQTERLINPRVAVAPKVHLWNL